MDETPADDDEEKHRKSFLKQLYIFLLLLVLGLVYFYYGQEILVWGEQKLAEINNIVEQYTEPEPVVIYTTPETVEQIPNSPEVIVIDDFLPITNERHTESCVTSNFVSDGSSETVNTKILGINGNSLEHYTLYLNMPSYGNYAVEFEIKTNFLYFRVLESNIVDPVYENFWEYDFRGETFVADLPNGDTVYLYIPWPDGYPSEYLYYVAPSSEVVCEN